MGEGSGVELHIARHCTYPRDFSGNSVAGNNTVPIELVKERSIGCIEEKDPSTTSRTVMSLLEAGGYRRTGAGPCP